MATCYTCNKNIDRERGIACSGEKCPNIVCSDKCRERGFGTCGCFVCAKNDQAANTLCFDGCLGAPPHFLAKTCQPACAACSTHDHVFKCERCYTHKCAQAHETTPEIAPHFIYIKTKRDIWEYRYVCAACSSAEHEKRALIVEQLKEKVIQNYGSTLRECNVCDVLHEAGATIFPCYNCAPEVEPYWMCTRCAEGEPSAIVIPHDGESVPEAHDNDMDFFLICHRCRFENAGLEFKYEHTTKVAEAYNEHGMYLCQGI